MMMLRLCVLVVLIAVSVAFAPMGGRLGAGRLMTTATKMAAKEGDAVPNVVFKARVRDDSLPQPNPFKWKDVSSADLFKGKRVVLFALPGGKHSVVEYALL